MILTVSVSAEELPGEGGLKGICRFNGVVGLYYYNARWMDPDTGRFTSEDPARDGENWFIYGGNNPLVFVDPSGLVYVPADLDKTGATKKQKEAYGNYLVSEMLQNVPWYSPTYVYQGIGIYGRAFGHEEALKSKGSWELTNIYGIYKAIRMMVDIFENQLENDGKISSEIIKEYNLDSFAIATMELSYSLELHFGMTMEDLLAMQFEQSVQQMFGAALAFMPQSFLKNRVTDFNRRIKDPMTAEEERISRDVQRWNLKIGSIGKPNSVKSRIAELEKAIPANSRDYITMAVADVEDAQGNKYRLVSTSEPRGYLRPGVTLKKREVLVIGTGHAEADIVNFANANNLKIKSIGATRPVCLSCQGMIKSTSAIITTPTK